MVHFKHNLIKIVPKKDLKSQDFGEIHTKAHGIDTNIKWLERKYVSWEDLEEQNEVNNEFTENF